MTNIMAEISEKILLIGDVHCKIAQYENILLAHPTLRSYQIGDFGFDREYQWWTQKGFPNAHILRGNHDSPQTHPQIYQKWFWHPEVSIFGIAGADSIDKYRRTEGVDWWRDEELSTREQNEALDAYEGAKPRIMLSHDCPGVIRELMFGIHDRSPTSDLLNAAFEIHQPQVWVFGHHHRPMNLNWGNTKFICLAELETLILKHEN